MKIAICVNHFHPFIGGSEKVVQIVADHLSAHHDVSIITRYTDRNSQHYNYPVHGYLPRDLITFDQYISDINPDIVIVYSDVFDFFEHLITRDNQKFQLVICPCGANWLFSHQYFINTLLKNKKIGKVICHSKITPDAHIFKFKEIREKTVVIPNGVSLNEFYRPPPSKQHLLPNFADKKWIVNVSNFFPGKGQHHLADIVHRLDDSFAYLQISNDIQYPIGEHLEKEWWGRTKQSHTVLLKNLPRNRVIDFMKLGDVFAFPSEKEVAPLVILEAMAANLPWVSADVGNIEELMGGKCIQAPKDSQGKSIINDRIKSGFVDYIRDVLNQPVNNDGRKQVESVFNWDRILPMYDSAIESLHVK